jgi:LysM repeat protein
MAVTIRGSGQVPVQIVQTVKTDTYTQNSNTFTDITGYSVTITPTSASNRVLVMCTLNICVVNGYNLIGRLMRDSTPIFIGDAAGSRPRGAFQNFFLNVQNTSTIPVTFLDSPNTTSAVTYKFQVKAGVTLYVNRTEADRDDPNFDVRAPSSIIVMEISG